MGYSTRSQDRTHNHNFHFCYSSSIMPFKPIETPKCPKCGKSVYAAEERIAGGHKFHKGCFKCDICATNLDSTTVAEHEAKLYCKQCHGRKYGPKGYGFGGGAGALNMDTGTQFGNKESEMSNNQLLQLVVVVVMLVPVPNVLDVEKQFMTLNAPLDPLFHGISPATDARNVTKLWILQT